MRILITVITINLLMLFAAHQAQAEVVTLKGFYIGMDKKEANKHYKKNVRGKYNWKHSNYLPTLAGFEGIFQTDFKKVKIDGKKRKIIDAVGFFICYDTVSGCQSSVLKTTMIPHSVQTHYHIVDLLKQKYPLQCEEYTVSNMFGKESPAEECRYYDGKGSVMYTNTYWQSSSTGGIIAIYSEERFASKLNSSKIDTNDL